MDKMREQFEAAYAAKSTARNGRFCPEVLTRGDDGEYMIPSVQSAWWAWQASREDVVVQMPDRAAEAYREEFDDVEGGSFNEAAYIRDVRKAIEARGLKVAP
ncbi:hypothetical protein [Pseudomonas juntendi]|uniref:hypothetical protein n=1 Tax=Pseudomonas juntendi TaxID=2666183 RepID=UPI00137A1C19|nr:hypothetical protein [Pseudomonas juntendi]